MAIKTDVNYPLLNDLVAMGILSAKSSPSLVGPFQIKTEAFTGDSSAATKTLAETPISGGIFGVVTIATASGTNNTLAALVEDTDFSISAAVLTYITDQSDKQVLLQYAY